MRLSSKHKKSPPGDRQASRRGMVCLLPDCPPACRVSIKTVLRKTKHLDLSRRSAAKPDAEGGGDMGNNYIHGIRFYEKRSGGASFRSLEENAKGVAAPASARHCHPQPHELMEGAAPATSTSNNHSNDWLLVLLTRSFRRVRLHHRPFPPDYRTIVTRRALAKFSPVARTT